MIYGVDGRASSEARDARGIPGWTYTYGPYVGDRDPRTGRFDAYVDSQDGNFANANQAVQLEGTSGAAASSPPADT